MFCIAPHTARFVIQQIYLKVFVNFVTPLKIGYLSISSNSSRSSNEHHDDVVKWKHFPRYWPFMRGIHRSPVNFPPKGQWRGALMFSLIFTGINGLVNNREAGDLRRYRTRYDVTVIYLLLTKSRGLCYRVTNIRASISNQSHIEWCNLINRVLTSTVEVRVWISNHIPHFYVDVIAYPYHNLSLVLLISVALFVKKRGLMV